MRPNELCKFRNPSMFVEFTNSWKINIGILQVIHSQKNSIEEHQENLRCFVILSVYEGKKCICVRKMMSWRLTYRKYLWVSWQLHLNQNELMWKTDKSVFVLLNGLRAYYAHIFHAHMFHAHMFHAKKESTSLVQTCMNNAVRKKKFISVIIRQISKYRISK